MKVVNVLKKLLTFILSCVFSILLILLIGHLVSQNIFTEENIDKIVDTEKILNIKQEGNEEKTIKYIISNELSERGISKKQTNQILESESLDNLISKYVYNYTEYILFSKEKPSIKENELKTIFLEEINQNQINQKEIDEYLALLTSKINESTPSIYELETMGYDINEVRLGFAYIHSMEGLVIVIAALTLTLILIGTINWNKQKAIRIVSIPTIIIGLILTMISLMEVNFMSKIINSEGIIDGMILMVVNESLKDLLTYGIILLAVGVILLVVTTILIKKGKNKPQEVKVEKVENNVKESLKDHIATPEKEIEEIGNTLEEKIEQTPELPKENLQEQRTNVELSNELPKVTLPNQQINVEKPEERIISNEELPKIEIESEKKALPKFEEIKAVPLNEIKKPEMELVEAEPLPKVEMPKEEPKEIEIVEMEKTHETEIEKPQEIENPFAYVEINDDKEEGIVKKEVEIKEPENIDLDITSPIKEIEESKKEKKEDDVELL